MLDVHMRRDCTLPLNIQLFQTTLSKEKQTSHKPRPQGSMGSFKSVFIAAEGSSRSHDDDAEDNDFYYVYLCPSYHETEPRTHR